MDGVAQGVLSASLGANLEAFANRQQVEEELRKHGAREAVTAALGAHLFDANIQERGQKALAAMEGL